MEYLIRLSLPSILLAGTAMAVLLVSAFWSRVRPSVLIGASGLAVAVSLGFCWREWSGGLPFSQGMLLFDRLAWGLDLILLISLFLTLLLSKDYLQAEGIRLGESVALLLFATVGTLLIAHGGDLIVIFLGIELATLSAIVLAGMRRGSFGSLRSGGSGGSGAARSLEASLKYFVLGAFASGFLLYGIALAYGAAGSTSLKALQELAVPADPILILAAVAFLLIGLGFKIAAVPFHFWSPDVYEGAPTPVTAFMASAIKTAGFAALIRVGLALSAIPQIPWVPILWTLAAATMTVGNLIAIRQTNIKRMLAYSSIAHAGYALVGVTAAFAARVLNESTLGAVLFYLFAYSLTTIGAFAVVIAVGRRTGERISEADELADYAGLSRRHPILAAALAITLFSLTGIPPTIGFAGKFFVFSGAVEAGLYGLVIVAVINSAVSVYYYLGPVVAMYFREPRGYRLPPLSYSLLVGIFLCLFAVLYLGLFPSDVFLIARESVRELIF